MDNNLKQLAASLQANKNVISQLMQSPDGRRLMELMRQQGGGQQLKKAAGAAAQGNTDDLAKMVQAMMRTPEGAQLVQRIAAFFIRLGHRLRLVKDAQVAALRVNTMLDSYHASVLRLSRHPRQILIQLGLSALSVLGLMSVILFVYRAFGEVGTPWHHLLTISFLLFLSASYTPLPGASGAQEGGFLLYYRGLFTQGTAGLALLVWRFMTYYLFLIIGAATTILTHLRGSAKARAAARGSSE